MNVQYVCSPGYRLEDPLRGEASSGKIICYNGFEWNPYPFPVCRVNNSSAALSDELRDASAVEHRPYSFNEKDYHSTPSILSTDGKRGHASVWRFFHIAVALAVLGCVGSVGFSLLAYCTLPKRYVSAKFARFSRRQKFHRQYEHVYHYPVLRASETPPEPMVP